MRPRQLRSRAVLESLELRRLLHADDGVFIDHGVPLDPEQPPAFQLNGRWTTTASGSTGSTGNGMTLTYSIAPDGTSLPVAQGEPAAGSDLRARLNAIYGNEATWLPVIHSMFNSWSAISGITYVYETNDDGAAFSSSSTGRGQLGVRGDVRIGSHIIDGTSSILAYNYFPNYGDMVIDSADLGAGGYMSNTSNNSRRLRNVLAHEHGHGLGLNHVEPVNQTKLMEPFVTTSFDGPQFDDILAVNRNYGDFYEKGAANNTFATAVNRGTLSDGTDNLTNLSLATTSDLDFYKFTTTVSKSVIVNVSPFGPTYLQGPQGGSSSSFNASAQMDLQVQLLASDGSTVLSSANLNAVGSNEVVGFANLSAGTYFVKVLPAPGASNNAQMYSLSTTLAAPASTTTVVALDGSNNLTITDAAQKTDNLSILTDPANSRYIITDSASFLSSSVAGSSGSGSLIAYVPYASVTGASVIVSTQNGNDVIRINGTQKPVTIDAGAGTDTLNLVETTAGAPVTVAPSIGNDLLNVNTDNSGAASVQLAATQSLGAINTGAGGTATLTGSSMAVATQALSVTGGKLDLRSNDLAINYTGASVIGTRTGSVYTGVTGLIQSGRNGGLWNGLGVTTSMTDATSGSNYTTLAVAEAAQVAGVSGAQTTVWNGLTIDATTVLVKYTYGGDANLDGQVDIDDYGLIDFNASTGGALAGFFNGDFDYSGSQDIDDYGIIDFVVNIQGPPL